MLERCTRRVAGGSTPASRPTSPFLHPESNGRASSDSRANGNGSAAAAAEWAPASSGDGPDETVPGGLPIHEMTAAERFDEELSVRLFLGIVKRIMACCPKTPPPTHDVTAAARCPLPRPDAAAPRARSSLVSRSPGANGRRVPPPRVGPARLPLRGREGAEPARPSPRGVLAVRARSAADQPGGISRGAADGGHLHYWRL